MTQLREWRPVGITPPRIRVNHTFEWVLGAIGIIATGVGAFLYFADPLATINVLGWTSQVGVIAAGWGYVLQIAGALLVAIGLMLFARKVRVRRGYWSFAVWASTFTAIAALAHATAFAYLYVRWLI